MKSYLHGAGIPVVVAVSLLSGCADSPAQSQTSAPPPSVPALVANTEVPAPTPERTATTNGMVYPDLTSAPVDGWVTVYGVDSEDSTWPVVSHAPGQTVVQVPQNAKDLVVGGYHIEVSVHRGRVVEVTPDTLEQAITGLRPGDAVYLHEGIYDGHYDHAGWNESTLVLNHGGTSGQPVSFATYPGEHVVLDNTGPDSGDRPVLTLGANAGQVASWVTFAGLDMVARQAVVHGGGNTSDATTPESGATHVRVVGCSLEVTDATTNTGTGILSIQGDGWSVLGNVFIDPSNREVINNNHAIYIQNGADSVEVADNTLTDLHMGHTIQIHQDGDPMVYEDIWIHDNIIRGDQRDDQRGITVSNVDPSSSVRIEGNTIENVGQEFGAVTVYSGSVEVRENVIRDVNGPALMLNGGAGLARSVTWSGNTVSGATGEVVAVNGAVDTEAHP